MALKDIRPPTPGMQQGELHQWRQRIYEALRELASAIGSTDAGVSIDHDDLENNGGSGSHATIASHIASAIAHGVSSRLVGEDDVEQIVLEILSETTDLEHGVEVDNPSSGVHGVTGDIVGTTDAQTLTNKTIVGADNSISGLRHGVEVDNSYQAHGAIGEVVGTLNPQQLVNKIWSALKQTTSVDVELTQGNEVINVDTAAVTITLPLAATANGMRYYIINSSTGDITVDPQPGETIQGETSQTVPTESTMVVQSLETEWRIV